MRTSCPSSKLRERGKTGKPGWEDWDRALQSFWQVAPAAGRGFNEVTLRCRCRRISAWPCQRCRQTAKWTAQWRWRLEEDRPRSHDGRCLACFAGARFRRMR